MPEHRTMPEHDEAAARKGDDKARKRDPHGAGPADAAGAGKPAASPTSDRHDTETAGGDSS